MVRGENNLDELYYLCEVNGVFYVVLETDFVDPASYQTKEAAGIFGSKDLQIEGWMVRKDKVKDGVVLVSPDISLGQEEVDLLVSSTEGSYLKHAVLKMQSAQAKKHYDPTVYGGAC